MVTRGIESSMATAAETAQTQPDAPGEPRASGGEIDVALQLILELRESGRVREAEAIYALVRAEVARQDPIRDADLTAEDVAALERADAQMAAGRVIPHAVVIRGPAACDEFIRRRDAGELDPETAAAIKAFRLGWEADRRASAPHG
jgi:hypothetical protein